MPKPSIRRFLVKTLGQIPLRAVLIIPFVLQMLLIVGLIGFLSFRNGQEAVRDLAAQLEGEVAERIDQTLKTYLDMPRLANETNADAVRMGLLNLDDVGSLENYLWNQFQRFNRRQPGDTAPPAQISFLAIGTAKGDYIDVGYDPQGKLVMNLRDQRQDANLQIWRLNDWGKRVELLQTTPYDPRTRDWYQAALQAGRMVWLDPYVTVPPDVDLVISADQPLYNQQGNFVGVADATLSLSSISEFLKTLKVGQSGQIFIMELDGELIASSVESPFIPSQKQPQRLNVISSLDPLTRDTATFLMQRFGSFDRVHFGLQQRPSQLEFRDFQGRTQFVRIQPIRNDQGLDWLVVITIPEDDFMAQIYANTRLTILLCLLALAGAIALGIATSRWITKPILQLSRAANALALGDWDRSVNLQRADELGILADAFNHMRQELKRSHQQLEEYSLGLKQKNEQLRTLEAELRRQLNLFLHAVSHDLRNPVLGMSMVLNNLSQQSGDELILPRKVLERMQESNQRQLELINSLIDTHAAEIWGITLHPKPLMLHSLVRSAVADLLPMIEKANATLDNRISPELPRVSADPLQLTRVYQNLIANALKHNPPGLTLTLAAQAEAAWIRCTVTDNGVGISAEQREKLFDPYFRGSSKPKSVGLGLGLYLCRQIIQAHGGEIGVESTPGEGTTFWFTLPREKSGDLACQG